MMWETIWSILGKASTGIGLVAAWFAFQAWVQASNLWKANRESERKRHQPITLVLQGPANLPSVEQTRVTLPYKIRRDGLSRSELMGVLNMYHGRGSGTYESIAFRQIFEDGTFDRVLRGDSPHSDGEVLVIPWATAPDLSNKLRQQGESPAAVGLAQSSVDRSAATDAVGSPVGQFDQYGHPPMFAVVSNEDRIVRVDVNMPASLSSDQLVVRADAAVKELDVRGGKLLLLNGRMTLAVASVIVHKTVHLFSAIAIMDPKLNAYIVTVIHGGDYEVGQLIHADNK